NQTGSLLAREKIPATSPKIPCYVAKNTLLFEHNPVTAMVYPPTCKKIPASREFFPAAIPPAVRLIAGVRGTRRPARRFRLAPPRPAAGVKSIGHAGYPSPADRDRTRGRFGAPDRAAHDLSRRAVAAG